MLRSAVSTFGRRASPGLIGRGASARSTFPAASLRLQSTVAKEEEEKSAPAATSSWDPIYSIPLGIAFAVPAVHYEWYIFNEETQLAACFVAFVTVIYKNFGGMIHDSLSEDGKRILEAQNANEDKVITYYEGLLDTYKKQTDISSVVEDIIKIRVETFEKLNEAGKIKPHYDLKAQVEKAMAVMAAEEVSMQEKMKTALMVEATEAVSNRFASDEALIEQSLSSAIGQLKGGAGGAEDPVKAAYLQFFKEKVAAAETMDAAAETAAARASMVTKLNSVAMNEGFLFRFGDDGKPYML